MNELQSKINAAEARINQLKNSELFTEADRLKLLPKAEKELEQLLLEKADNIISRPLFPIVRNDNKIFNDFVGDPTNMDKIKKVYEKKGRNKN